MEDSLRVQEVCWDHPDACNLRQQQRNELATRYGHTYTDPSPPPNANDMTCFCVAYQCRQPVGCGGLRKLDQHSAELMRMFVTKEARGKGAANAVLAFLEHKSLALGIRRLLLETGDKLPEAHRFYKRNGYQTIPNYGYYAGIETSICMQKKLTETQPDAKASQ